jgi:hypothetical protein
MYRASDVDALVNDPLHYLDNYDGHGARSVAGLRRAA